MKKKILAALSALTLGATMMGGMAMTAGAYCIHDDDNNCISDIGFYANYDVDGDDVDEWAKAPHGMYDRNIADVTVNENGTYTLELQNATYDIEYVDSNGDTHVIHAAGNVTSIAATNGGQNLIEDGYVTLSANTTYYLVVNNYHSRVYEVQIRVESCSCTNCDC